MAARSTKPVSVGICQPIGEGSASDNGSGRWSWSWRLTQTSTGTPTSIRFATSVYRSMSTSGARMLTTREYRTVLS